MQLHFLFLYNVELQSLTITPLRRFDPLRPKYSRMLSGALHQSQQPALCNVITEDLTLDGMFKVKEKYISLTKGN